MRAPLAIMTFLFSTPLVTFLALSVGGATVEHPDAERPASPCVEMPLSQQSCNTECQRRQTDCALSCDQDAPCIRRCRSETEECVRNCARGPDAGAPTPARPVDNAAPSGPSILPDRALPAFSPPRSARLVLAPEWGALS